MPAMFCCIPFKLLIPNLVSYPLAVFKGFESLLIIAAIMMKEPEVNIYGCFTESVTDFNRPAQTLFKLRKGCFAGAKRRVGDAKRGDASHFRLFLAKRLRHVDTLLNSVNRCRVVAEVDVGVAKTRKCRQFQLLIDSHARYIAHLLKTLLGVMVSPCVREDCPQ